MSSTTTNLGLTKMTNSETIGQWSNANNGSGGNLDIIDTKMGPVGNTSLQAQVNALNSQMTTVHDTSTTLSALHNGINAIKINSGTTIGEYTASNNMRGFAIKDGTTCVGFLSTFNGDNFIVVGNNGLNTWQYAYAH